MEETLDKLNNLWINSYKLRVYLPRFDRTQTNHGKTQCQKFDASVSRKTPEKSYKDAVIGHTGEKASKVSTNTVQAF
ncbi:hypothetical protein ACS0TY_017678 [Phlomoides rotata]